MFQYKAFKAEKLLWPVFFGLMFLKYGYHGFKYFPILDDWIQYGSYSLQSNIFENIIKGSMTYATRPLASFSDPYIWAQFWPNMGIPFFLITVMHAMSAFFLYKVIAHFKLPVGLPFLVVYGLLPLGTEGSYWISASSRLVVGMFFMSLALFLWIRLIQTQKWPYVIGVFLAHLLSMGYYEQVSALSAFLMVIVILASFKQLKHKWLIVIPFFNFAMMVSYYNFFGDTGNLAQRGQFVTSDYLSHFKEAFDASMYVFGSVQVRLMTNGLFRGLELLVREKSFFYLLLMGLFSLLAGVVHYRKDQATTLKKSLLTIISGGILIWIPLTINFMLAVIWICNRNVFPSLIGIAILLQGIWVLGFHGKVGKLIKSILLTAMIFVFLVVNVSEIDDYKNASEIDYEIATHILDAMDVYNVMESDLRVMVFNGESTYIEQNSYHHDHIHNVTTSDWAMTGALRAVSRDLNVKPLIMHGWAGGNTFIPDASWSSSLILGIDADRNIVRLTAKPVETPFIELYTDSGDLFGLLERTSEIGHHYFHTRTGYGGAVNGRSE